MTDSIPDKTTVPCRQSDENSAANDTNLLTDVKPTVSRHGRLVKKHVFCAVCKPLCPLTNVDRTWTAKNVRRIEPISCILGAEGKVSNTGNILELLNSIQMILFQSLEEIFKSERRRRSQKGKKRSRLEGRKKELFPLGVLKRQRG
ncbi:hypothetical protein TNCV_4690951 [Trichonephila clavipes]|nr:hypothetical protein TNCV_4690951 [Trichonephila clavipes]